MKVLTNKARFFFVVWMIFTFFFNINVTWSRDNFDTTNSIIFTNIEGKYNLALDDYINPKEKMSFEISKIIIDPGHGGKDCGALGVVEGVYEKDITLEISRCLARKIQEELGSKVVLTRIEDQYVSLEERTLIANTQEADLFISIHTNSSEEEKSYGIETFFLGQTKDDSIAVNIADDLENNVTNTTNKFGKSSQLAFKIQNSLCSHLSSKYDNIIDRGVKQAPFYVLLGVKMPAVLVETSFISNTRECARLKKPSYQEAICDGIVVGIKKYIKSK